MNMTIKNYQDRAILTESRPTHLAMSADGLSAILGAAVVMAEILDQAKKTLFYGKTLDLNAFDLLTNDASRQLSRLRAISGSGQLNKVHQATEIDLRKLHSAIGVFTEGGELIEAVKSHLDGGALDNVNFSEEVGDVLWYCAIGADASATTLETIQETNIRKLEARFPDKFTGQSALNRDLATERKILEDGCGK